MSKHMLPLPFLFLMLCGSRGAVKGTSPVPTELTVLQGDSISQALAGGGGAWGSCMLARPHWGGLPTLLSSERCPCVERAASLLQPQAAHQSGPSRSSREAEHGHQGGLRSGLAAARGLDFWFSFTQPSVLMSPGSQVPLPWGERHAPSFPNPCKE